MTATLQSPTPHPYPQTHKNRLFAAERQAKANGVTITITPRGFCIDLFDRRSSFVETLWAEIYRDGLLIKRTEFSTLTGYVDCDKELDPRECGLWVKDSSGNTLCSLNVEIDLFPFMRLQGEQHHITENYVAVPPALTITDEAGAIWTFGFVMASKDKSPKGEFAFDVVRNGVNTGEIASRIERRNSRIRIFTAHGWKVWTGKSFF